MDDIKKLLQDSAAQMGIAVSQEQAEQFEQYMALLVEWNGKMNLTAIKDPKEIVIKHFVDSLTVLSVIKPKKNARIIDVGSGAGFPGIPLKIMRDDLKLTLLDSLNKRLIFLEEVCKALGIEAKRIHARAEEAGRDLDLRMKFDIVTARAVAPLNILCEYCLPFLRLGGAFVVMKGPNLEAELQLAENAIRTLGCALEENRSFTLPDGSNRSILIIRRKKNFSGEYPRVGTKIAKKPL